MRRRSPPLPFALWFAPALELALALALALPGCSRAQDPPAPVGYWQLPTGSRIAYIHVPGARAPNGARRALPPLVLVHGGPGAYQVAFFDEHRDWYDRLAALGFDVYLYDQIGSGLSPRLADPRQYTVARHVADLEAIRARIGADRMILLGDSWGGTLVAHYIAAHSDRVDRVIFTSPGAIDMADWEPYAAVPRVAPQLIDWVRTRRGEAAAGRLAELDGLIQRDVVAAHDLVPDAGIDPLFDGFVNERIMPTTVDDPARMKPAFMNGMGWWVQVMTSWDQRHGLARVRPGLAMFDRPVLVLHGTSDYLPPGMADQYVATFPHARFVQVPHAGHLIWLDDPVTYGREIVRFLQAAVAERRLPTRSAH
jgi:proline iminopeptidase